MVGTTDGGSYTMRAVYVEIRRPDLLVWRDVDNDMLTTITFVDLHGGRTEVVTHQSRVPATMSSPQAQSGFRTSLDRFDAYVRDGARA